MQREQVHLLVDTLLDLVQRLSMPPEAKAHLRTAHREVLLGVRAMIDTAIAGTVEEPPQSGPRKITLDD